MAIEITKDFEIDYDISYIPMYYNNGLIGVQINVLQCRIQVHRRVDSTVVIYEEHLPIYSKVLD